MEPNIEATSSSKFSSPWYRREGVVYFVLAGADCDSCRSIKIGVSTREGLLNRLKGIQSANHGRIRLLRMILVQTMKEAEDIEKKWHERFHELARIPGDSAGHEWFKAPQEILDCIEKAVPPINQEINSLPNMDVILRRFTDSN